MLYCLEAAPAALLRSWGRLRGRGPERARGPEVRAWRAPVAFCARHPFLNYLAATRTFFVSISQQLVFHRRCFPKEQNLCGVEFETVLGRSGPVSR